MTRPRFKPSSSRIHLHHSTWFLGLCEISHNSAKSFTVTLLFAACHVYTFQVLVCFGPVLLQFRPALHKLTHKTCRTPNKKPFIILLLFSDVTRHLKRYKNISSPFPSVLPMITLSNSSQGHHHYRDKPIV